MQESDSQPQRIQPKDCPSSLLYLYIGTHIHMHIHLYLYHSTFKMHFLLSENMVSAADIIYPVPWLLQDKEGHAFISKMSHIRQNHVQNEVCKKGFRKVSGAGGSPVQGKHLGWGRGKRVWEGRCSNVSNGRAESW